MIAPGLNEFVKAGVNETTGTFGSGGDTRPGLQFDSNGTGTFPADDQQGDYLTPGSPFDGISVKVDGANVSNNNSYGTDIAGGWTDGLAPTASLADWTGTWVLGGATWQLRNIYRLPAGAEFVDIETQITAGSAAADVWFGRFIDPDAMPLDGDTSSTDNALGYGAIPEENVAFSEATVSRYALGLYSTDANVDAGISADWTSEADGYTDSPYFAPELDADGNPVPVNYGRGDDTIGLSWHWTSVGAGDIVTARYAYIFGPSAFSAATDAVEGGAGGGADILTGDLVDVGSATDAAAGPTIVGETFSSILRHRSSVAGGVQTIARTEVTDARYVYSDGSTGEARTSSVTLAPLNGRMDQGARMLHALDLHGLGFVRGAQAGYLTGDIGAGETADSRMVRFGLAGQGQDGTEFFGGSNRIWTSATSGDMQTRHVGIGLSRTVEGFAVSGSLNVASQDVSYGRTIGDFANTGEFDATDRWMEVEVAMMTGTFRPHLGAVYGMRSTNAWTEAGSIQSALSHDAADETYRHFVIGGTVALAEIAELSVDRSTDGTLQAALGLSYGIGQDISFEADLERQISDTSSTTGLSAGVEIRF